MIRYAKTADSRTIQTLINNYAKRGEMLSVSLNDVYERLYEFAVWETDGQITGVCALHPMWGDVAEIRSLAVRTDNKKQGIGRELVKFMLERARIVGFTKVFALTYSTEFFKKCGFAVTDIENLPKKIWTDCLKCVKYPNCDETAVIIELTEVK